jgi:hypothetical protein
MQRTCSSSTSSRRRGIALLVVICLLTLFAIVGLGFVLYANSVATASRLSREAGSQTAPDVEPELAFSFFMGQLLYDVPDDERGIFSALRGHSLARNMFGLNYTLGPNGSLRLHHNDAPFNGTGRLHQSSPFPDQDDYFLINYTYFARDQFLRDPERSSWRAGLKLPGAPDTRAPYLGGFNAPYTYPDLNNLFLAAVKAGSFELPTGGEAPPGTVLMPSFHRPWLFGRLTDIPDGKRNRGNPNWTNQHGKYLLLRPRPIDMGPGFPYPEDEGGDVKNLVGGPGYYDPFTQRIHNNDSVWIDLDFPVLTAGDGRKYKPLFAPLIVDLDNRVNLNVHGNLRGADNAAHASNSGWGAWEVNPARVLDDDSGEWTSLLHGNRSTAGRYGRDRWPHSSMPGNMTRPIPDAPFYAPIDFDGSNELAGGTPSEQLRLPGSLPSRPFQCFGIVPPGYGNDSRLERVNHPSLYNPFRPAAPDRVFALSNLEALLRYGDTGSPALTSDLFALCPRNFGDPADPVSAARRRGLVTLQSMDPDRPGISPWFYPGDRTWYNRLAPLAAQPSGMPVASPLPEQSPKQHPDSEFGPDGRAAAAITALRRLDLNRYLPDYPRPDPEIGLITDHLGFFVAQRARQYFAAEIFERLWRATGTGNPALIQPPIPGAVVPEAERWEALRTLAQLAVNIVDYIDSDDYITPFNWYPPHRFNAAGEWVFGTELPRLVINEAYVQIDNDPSDPGIKPGNRDDKEEKRHATRYNVNVWVELFNPMFTDRSGSDNGDAVLQSGPIPVYQLVVGRGEPRLRDRGNVRGNPSNVIKTVSSYGADRAKWVVQASNGRYVGEPGGTQGFYVLGPSTSYLARANPNLPATLLTPDLSYSVPANPIAQRPTLLLRRLACPHLRPNAPGLPNYEPKEPYNPYVTVDYMEEVPSNDGLIFDAQGRHFPHDMYERYSYGRKQPYAAHRNLRRQQFLNPAQLDQPQTTFFQQNADKETPGPNRGSPPPGNSYPPFDWLVHLDRPLISPAELLQVSAYKPHELTQQFMTGDTPPQRFNYRANWFDEDLAESDRPLSHRLYRVLEFLGTGNRTLGMMNAGTVSLRPVELPGRDIRVVPAAMSGRTASGGTWQIDVGSCLVIDRGEPGEEVVRVKTVELNTQPPYFTADFLKMHRKFTIAPTIISERIPGRINLNTIWDKETFQALCDPQPSNGFSNPEIVSAIFKRLKGSRTIGTAAGPETPGPADHPFRSLTAGFTPYDDSQFPTGGLQDTILRSDQSDRQPLLSVPGMAHPYQSSELLTKIFNQTTIRSNVFAVWVTVGFFEVTDETTRPVKLGAESGRAENRQVRHRMFAIVDRSVLATNPGPQPHFDLRAPRSPGTSAGLITPYFSIID